MKLEDDGSDFNHRPLRDVAKWENCCARFIVFLKNKTSKGKYKKEIDKHIFYVDRWAGWGGGAICK